MKQTRIGIKMKKIKLGLCIAVFIISVISGCINSMEGLLDTKSPATHKNAATQEKPGTLTSSITPEKTAISTSTSLKITSTSKHSETESDTTSTQEPIDTQYETNNSWVVYTDIIRDLVIISRLDGLGKRIIFDGLCDPRYMSWSPSGDWIAFTGQKVCGDGESQIYLIRPDGSAVKRITYTPGSKYIPEWSPDGRYISYIHGVGLIGNGKYDLFQYELKYSNIHQLTHTDNIIEEAQKYSPDGKKIAFTINGNLMVMNNDGTDMKEVLRSPLDVAFIDWSPDGKYIFFTASEGLFLACDDIYLFDLNSEEVELILDSSNHITQLELSASGEWIWYQGEKCVDGQPSFRDKKIYSVRIDGNELREHNIYTGGYFDISPLPPLEKDHTFTISDLGNNLRLRNNPSLSGSIIDWLKGGDFITVLEGPVKSDGYLWWQVEVAGKTQNGWIAEVPGYFHVSSNTNDEQY